MSRQDGRVVLSAGMRLRVLAPRWRKVLHDLWENKTRTLLVVLSIAVGVFAVGMIAGTRALFDRNVADNWNAETPASAVLVTDAFDEELVQTVRRMSDVAQVEARKMIEVRARVQGASGAWSNLALYAVADYKDIRVEKITPEEGQWPPANNVVLLERSSLEWLNVKIGDTLVVETPDGKKRELRIAGTAHAFHIIPSALAGRASGFITLDSLEWLGSSRQFNVLSLTVSRYPYDKAFIQRVVDRVADKIERSGRTVYRKEVPGGKYYFADMVKTFLLILGALGLLSLFLSGFLVVNTISALVTQQVRQIGVMKAIGASAGQIIGMYLATVAIFGLLALGVAIPLGSATAVGLVRFAAGYLNFNMASYISPPWVLILQVGVGLIVPLLAALYPVLAGARLTVREAIAGVVIWDLRGAGRGLGWRATIALARLRRAARRQRLLAAVWHWLAEHSRRQLVRVPRPLLLSLRNTFRRKGRLALTLFTLVLGGAIFVSVFSVRSSLLATLDALTHYWQHDIEVTLARPYRAEALANEALSVPDIAAAEVWSVNYGFRVRADGTQTARDIALIGLPASSAMIQPNVLQGRWLLPDDESALVVNADVVQEEPDLRVGQDIVIKTNGRESTWRVVGIVAGQMAGPLAYANYPYFTQAIREVGRGNRLVLRTAAGGGAAEAAALKSLEARFTVAGLRLRSSETRSEMRDTASEQFSLIVGFLLIMAVLLAIVGGLGLMGTMSLNVLERTREIGILRAIGAGDRAIRTLVVVEGLGIGLMSWCAGILLALPIAKLLSNAVGEQFLHHALEFSFPPLGVGLWLIVVVCVAAIASWLPARRAVQLTVREVLTYE
jgi:putative ABC transport system permease protein